jgi:hypothetical protein
MRMAVSMAVLVVMVRSGMIMGMMRLSMTMVMRVVAVLFVFHPVRIPSIHQTKPRRRGTRLELAQFIMLQRPQTS